MVIDTNKNLFDYETYMILTKTCLDLLYIYDNIMHKLKSKHRINCREEILAPIAYINNTYFAKLRENLLT